MSRKRFFDFHAGLGEIRLGSRRFRMPQSAPVRIALGSGLVVGGILGFLPILGFWMFPLGLLVLSQDVPVVRRWRRIFVVRMRRRAGTKPGAGPRTGAKQSQCPPAADTTDE
ncbi:hypothetical protein PZ897_16915 [Hoeflea sp. YIM 152468]|uniref:hypothetical protein n=1 Tax=Hoeflea sp. YIM 152468 TaxID=3031759 RepID=UPI0023DBF110|nr:hypothetical protein [Hoeflea sp. YIM 152468]MDF1609868.1 hypothetical protein [Hoeflea sp. YIM 152468]